MLVISRRDQESFSIGDDITVQVLEIKGNQVRIGITAPKSLTILREELTRHGRPNTPSRTKTETENEAG